MDDEDRKILKEQTYALIREYTEMWKHLTLIQAKIFKTMKMMSERIEQDGGKR